MGWNGNTRKINEIKHDFFEKHNFCSMVIVIMHLYVNELSSANLNTVLTAMVIEDVTHRVWVGYRPRLRGIARYLC